MNRIPNLTALNLYNATEGRFGVLLPEFIVDATKEHAFKSLPWHQIIEIDVLRSSPAVPEWVNDVLCEQLREFAGPNMHIERGVVTRITGEGRNGKFIATRLPSAEKLLSAKNVTFVDITFLYGNKPAGDTREFVNEVGPLLIDALPAARNGRVKWKCRTTSR